MFVWEVIQYSECFKNLLLGGSGCNYILILEDEYNFLFVFCFVFLALFISFLCFVLFSDTGHSCCVVSAQMKWFLCVRVINCRSLSTCGVLHIGQCFQAIVSANLQTMMLLCLRLLPRPIISGAIKNCLLDSVTQKRPRTGGIFSLYFFGLN